MSARQATPDDDSPEARAAQWIARRNAGWTSADAEAFANWCADDPRHAAAAAEVEATERLLSRLPETAAASQFWQEIDGLTRPHKKGNAITRFPLWSNTVAAAAAVVLLLTAGAVAFSVLAPFERAYTTVAGSSQQITLPDGSQVTLAAESSLDVRYSRSERSLQLLKGEAVFAVTKDVDRPFLVAAGGFSVRAVGTAFRVRHEEAGGIHVAVTEGQVRVSQVDDAALRLPAFTGSGLLLAAGDSVLWDGRLASEPVVVRPSTENPPLPAPAGIPRLVFANTSLQEAVDQLNRHSAVQIEIADPALAARTIGGGLRGDSAEAFAAALAANGDIIVERPGPDRIVLRQAP